MKELRSDGFPKLGYPFIMWEIFIPRIPTQPKSPFHGQYLGIRRISLNLT